MSNEPPIWLTEAEVVSLLDLGEAITAVRSGFEQQARGQLANLAKAQKRLGDTTLHATGAVTADGLSGAKVWTHTPTGATPLMQVWNSVDGELVGVIEAFALGQYRTAAVTGVATDLLALPEATEVAILGSGHQALAQAAAVKAVRNVARFRVWSPREESRVKMATEIENALALPASAVASVDEAVDGAQVIVTATRGTEPFLSAENLQEGVHINAIGAIGLERAELDQSVFERAAVIAVDDVPSARSFSAELRTFCSTEDLWRLVVPLASVATADQPRPAPTDVTVFKAVGAGVGDLALAQFAIEQAHENGIGMPLPIPARSRPRLRSSLRRPLVAGI